MMAMATTMAMVTVRWAVAQWDMTTTTMGTGDDDDDDNDDGAKT